MVAAGVPAHPDHRGYVVHGHRDAERAGSDGGGWPRHRRPHRLLRAWVDRHRGGTATSADFVSLAEQVSGKDLDSSFDAWLFGARRPGRTAENGL